MKNDIALLIVNYNSSDACIEYMTSIFKLNDYQKIDIYIADSASTEDEIFKLACYLKQSNRPNIHLQQLKTNIGYFASARFLLDNCIKDYSLYNYYIVSNPDIVIKQNNFVNILSKSSQNHSVIATRIISLVDSIDQNPHLTHPVGKLKSFFYKLYFSNFYIAKLYQHISKYKNKKEKELQSGEIYSAHGAFMIFATSFFEKGGYIDNRFFLYAEEATIAEISRTLNIKIYLQTDLIVYHNENVATGRGFTMKKFNFQKDAYFFLKENYNYYK